MSIEGIRNEIKSYIAMSGWTLTEIVKEMNRARPMDEQTTTQNISNKLTRGTIKYSECKEIAYIIGFSIKWDKQIKNESLPTREAATGVPMEGMPDERDNTKIEREC